jgi:hypothetical protein
VQWDEVFKYISLISSTIISICLLAFIDFKPRYLSSTSSGA